MSSRPPFRRLPESSGFGRPVRTAGRLPRRYKVIVHPTGQALVAVRRAVMDLTRFGEAEATYRMWEAHRHGRALVLVTHLERAELFVEQFADRGLTASLEPE